jgi:hypothetical protein
MRRGEEPGRHEPVLASTDDAVRNPMAHCVFCQARAKIRQSQHSPLTDRPMRLPAVATHKLLLLGDDTIECRVAAVGNDVLSLPAVHELQVLLE